MKLKTLRETSEELKLKLADPKIGLNKDVLTNFVETMRACAGDSKEETLAMNLLDNEVNRLLDNGTSEELCANIYHLVSFPLQREYIWYTLLEKAFDLYKKTDNRLDAITCGLNLVIHYDKDVKDPQKAIHLLFDCLSMAEKAEGHKGDLYYSILCDENLNVLSSLHLPGYSEYFKDFLIDYTPNNNVARAWKLFEDLSYSCNKMLNKLPVAVDDVYFPHYIKYKKKEIEYRKNDPNPQDWSEDKKDKAVYELMVFYTCAYENTKDVKYMESAKALVKHISTPKYKLLAREEMEELH